MKRVAVVGASGMVGSMLVDCLTMDASLSVVATVRDSDVGERARRRLGTVEWRFLDAESCTREGLYRAVGDAHWIINAIGVTKPYIRDNEPRAVERAVRLNAVFPYTLGGMARESGAQVLQITTDCVYSGRRGQYRESDEQDPLDVYGKTKSLGEPCLPNVHCVRCSIVGPEPKAYVHLLEWLRRQPPRAQLLGYTNHLWNGVTTLHFARLCRGIIAHDLQLPQRQHVVPAGVVTKGELLGYFAHFYQREDLAIGPCEAEVPSDRTLTTSDEDSNRRMWAAAGYDEPPTIARMIQEISEYPFRFEAL